MLSLLDSGSSLPPQGFSMTHRGLGVESMTMPSSCMKTLSI